MILVILLKFKNIILVLDIFKVYLTILLFIIFYTRDDIFKCDFFEKYIFSLLIIITLCLILN